MKQFLLLLAFLPGFTASAQLPDGSTAPDFTLTDLNGTAHNLYTYLDQGRTVFVEIFAAHCPTCWAYHQTQRLKDLYLQYGPPGTDELMVLALEYDQWNGANELMGIGDPWVTAGDWITSTPYPIFNVEDPDRGVFTDYNVTGYPQIYTVCPNRILERVFTFETGDQLYQSVQDCQATVGVPERADLGGIRFDPLTRSLLIDRYEQVRGLEIVDLQGRTLMRTGAWTRSNLALAALPSGVYLFKVRTHAGPVVRRLYVE